MPDPVQLLNMLVSIAAVALIVWGGRRSTFAPLLTIAWVLHCVLWLVSPLIIQLLLAEPVPNSAGPASRQQLALLASFSMLLLITLHLGLRRPFAVPVTRFFDKHAPPTEQLFWPTAVATVLLAVIERAITERAGDSFAEFAAFAVTADNTQAAQFGLLGTIETMLFGYGVAVLSMGRKTGVTRNTLIMAWIMLLMFCAFSIERGARSTALLPITLGVVTLSTLHGRTRKRATVLLMSACMLLVVVAAPVAAIMGAARGGTDGLSVQLIRDTYDVLLGSRSGREQVQLLASEVNRKFDAVGPAIELLAMEPPGSAGLKPITSAVFSPIPRALFLSKPVPTSRDGTALGTPYRVAATAYGDVDVGMVVPVSAPAIAVWEFGLLGPVVYVLMNLLNLVLLNTVLISRNVLARALSVSLVGLPISEQFIGPPSLLLHLGVRLVLYLSILAVALLGWRLLRTRMSQMHSDTDDGSAMTGTTAVAG